MRHFVSLMCALFVATFAFAGGPDSGSQPAVEQSLDKAAAQDHGRFAIGYSGSLLLGNGAEIAVRVTHNSNVRAGFNIMSYSHSFDKDGTSYDGHLGMKSIQAHYDFFPWAKHRFHVSPGLLAFLGSPVTAGAVLGPYQSVTLGGTQYTSDPNQPATLQGTIKFRQVSPMLTVGFGNLVRRDHKHFTVPIEIGVGFTGSAMTTLVGSGNLCDSSGNCKPVSSASVQQNIIAEQNKFNHSLSVLKVYPIISTGIAYKF